MKKMLKNGLYRLAGLFIATVGKGAFKLLFSTCRWNIQGLEKFTQLAQNEKCILALWHDRLALAPFILDRYAHRFTYAAFVSNSRDGELISRFVLSYKKGRTVRVPHNARHEALRELINHVKYRKSIAVITPDGPRGPRYKMKTGLAKAALETGAHVIALTWHASKTWELNTWDKMQIPKPFSTIQIKLGSPVQVPEGSTLEYAKTLLESHLKLPF
ncbi:MAG: lysophospholipid acyltransferase family protein [Parachlamydia sp.]|jgi:hypothetical protein|nr:lysophospholipid acyltransferase family protein [Parachlamydia sp.]